MQIIKSVLCGLAIVTLIMSCDGRSSKNSPSSQPPPSPVSKSFAVTVVAIDLRRSADALVLPVDGLPAKGATLSID